MEIEVIHAYLLGELEGEALQAFESQLAEDTALRMEVDIQREMLDHLKVTADISTARSAIADVHMEYDDSELIQRDSGAEIDPSIEPRVENPSKRWFFVSLIFFVLMLLLFLIRSLSGDEKAGGEELQFAEVPELPEASFATKGTSDQDLLNAGAVAFNNKDYKEAIVKFDGAIARGNGNVGEISFHKGLSLLGDKKYTAAITTFADLKERYPLFAKDADWYQAMALWYSGDRVSATTILEQFDSGNYRDKAQVYLKHVGR